MSIHLTTNSPSSSVVSPPVDVCLRMSPIMAHSVAALRAPFDAYAKKMSVTYCSLASAPRDARRDVVGENVPEPDPDRAETGSAARAVDSDFAAVGAGACCLLSPMNSTGVSSRLASSLRVFEPPPPMIAARKQARGTTQRNCEGYS